MNRCSSDSAGCLSQPGRSRSGAEAETAGDRDFACRSYRGSRLNPGDTPDTDTPGERRRRLL